MSDTNTTVQEAVAVAGMDVPMIDRNQAVAVSVTFRRLGDSRQGNMDEIETSADKDMGRFVKRLFCAAQADADGKEKARCAEYEAIRSFDNQTYNWILSQSVSLLGRRNVRLIKKDAVGEIDAYLKDRQRERQLLVNAFGKVYPIVVENARPMLNGQFRESDYPSVEEAVAKFSLEWDYLALGVPDNLPDDVKAEIAAKAEKTWAATAAEIRDGLRVGFVKLVEHLIDRLQAKGTEKKSKFHDSNIGNLLEFIDALERRNLTNDKALEEVANKAKALIASASSDDLKAKADVRGKMIEEMAKVKDAVDGLIGPEKRRKFNLD
jgi:hypothetical protein